MDDKPTYWGHDGPHAMHDVRDYRNNPTPMSETGADISTKNVGSENSG